MRWRCADAEQCMCPLAGKQAGGEGGNLAEEYDVLLTKYRTLKTRAAGQERAAAERYAKLEAQMHAALKSVGA